MPDMRETMAQLDERLADLRHQINALVTEPEPAPPPPPARSPNPMPAATELGSGGHPGGSAISEEQRATARAASDGVSQLGSQIRELLTVRERLVADARELLARYERQLHDLEAQDSSEVQSALAGLLSGAALPDPVSGPTSSPPRPAFYEGTVTVTVAGAHRIQTIQVVEDSLSRVRHVERVYIRRWHADQLLFELTLAAGVELIGELNRVLPFPFAVQSASAQQIVITLESEG